jgi:hypothetical protein
MSEEHVVGGTFLRVLVETSVDKGVGVIGIFRLGEGRRVPMDNGLRKIRSALLRRKKGRGDNSRAAD